MGKIISSGPGISVAFQPLAAYYFAKARHIKGGQSHFYSSQDPIASSFSSNCLKQSSCRRNPKLRQYQTPAPRGEYSVVMHLTQFSARLSHILWSHMKRANHKILGWFRQSHAGGEIETLAAAVGAPKVMCALTRLAAPRAFSVSCGETVRGGTWLQSGATTRLLVHPWQEKWHPRLGQGHPQKGSWRQIGRS